MQVVLFPSEVPALPVKALLGAIAQRLADAVIAELLEQFIEETTPVCQLLGKPVKLDLLLPDEVRQNLGLDVGVSQVKGDHSLLVATLHFELGVADLGDDAGAVKKGLVLDITVGDVAVTLVAELTAPGVAHHEETRLVVVTADDHRVIAGLLGLDLVLARNPDKALPGMEGVEDLQGDGNRITLSHGGLDVVELLLDALGLDHLTRLRIIDGFHRRLLGQILRIVRE